MTSPLDPKTVLHHYLRIQRQQLVAKLDGLTERQVRWPMTQTGTNLLGIVKHVAFVQAGYFGEVFGRPFPRHIVATDADPDADLWARADESRDRILELFTESEAHADTTIQALEIDSTGSVSWWPEARRQVTLHQILVHMVVEVSRHAGHADIIREMIDGKAGNDDGNLIERSDQEWDDYRLRLEQVAARFD